MNSLNYLNRPARVAEITRLMFDGVAVPAVEYSELVEATRNYTAARDAGFDVSKIDDVRFFLGGRCAVRLRPSFTWSVGDGNDEFQGRTFKTVAAAVAAVQEAQR